MIDIEGEVVISIRCDKCEARVQRRFAPPHFDTDFDNEFDVLAENEGFVLEGIEAMCPKCGG